jgi:hypothetical protein
MSAAALQSASRVGQHQSNTAHSIAITYPSAVTLSGGLADSIAVELLSFGVMLNLSRADFGRCLRMAERSTLGGSETAAFSSPQVEADILVMEVPAISDP